MTKKGKTHERLPSQPRPTEPQQLIEKGTTQDVTSVRAKGSGHRKKTADKWNQ
jgi:hypothetical protein